jgi:hypothetical protein
VIVLGLIRDFGKDLNNFMVRVGRGAVAAAPATPPAPPPATPPPPLVKPANPTDYFRFAGLGDIGFGQACTLGAPTAYLPASQVPANLPAGSNVNAPVMEFGGKRKLGMVSVTALGGGDWMVLSVTGEAQAKVGGSSKLVKCGY